jgi:hypothetical protein
LDPQEQRCIRTSRGAAASGLKLENGTKTGGTYLKVLGVELHGEAFLFPQSRWRPLFPATPLGDNFRDVRHRPFGPEVSRTPADFRLSGAQEAFAGVCPARRRVAYPWQHHSHLGHALRHLLPGAHGIRAQGA